MARTGVQRYAAELITRLEGRVHLISSNTAISGVRGHVWEQFVLPFRVGDHLLWSPCNTGPISVSRQVVTIHDASTLDHPEWFSSQFAALYRLLLPSLAKAVTKIITVSEFSKDRLISGTSVQPDKIVVVYNGVDPRFRPVDPDRITSLREKLALHKVYILVVGSLEPRKNLRRLLEAWKQVASEFRHIELVVAGRMDPRLYRNTGFTELPPGVRQIGYVDDGDLPALYSGALAFVYPSIYEGFGLPILEAMACGTPVITSNNTSLVEIASGAAELVDPFEAESIAGGIHTVVSDASCRESLIQKGLQRASMFTWEKAAEETWGVLEESC